MGGRPEPESVFFNSGRRWVSEHVKRQLKGVCQFVISGVTGGHPPFFTT
jgi:hypothetical protein